MISRNKKKPVTLITGYLGSGKTTLLNELLKNENSKGMALIVNDMGSINVDANLLQKNSVVEADAKMIALQNGCICCTLRDEFMEQIEQLSKDDHIHRILVEASGISDPASIAEGFLTYEEVKKSNVYLDSIVTVVDADRMYAEFLEDLEEDGQEEGEEDPDIINLVMDQIEFCNVVILNKCDLLSSCQLAQVKAAVAKLQQEATLIESIKGQVDPNCIFKGSKFDYDQVLNSSAFQKTLASKGRISDTSSDECGITSFVYEEKRPFYYDKFMHFVEEVYPTEIIRGKGYIWFREDPIHVQLFEQAGRNASVTELSNWVVALPEKEKQEVFENYPDVLDDWDETYGDRLNQIVFIGKDYDKEDIIRKLNECLEKENNIK